MQLIPTRSFDPSIIQACHLTLPLQWSPYVASSLRRMGTSRAAARVRMEPSKAHLAAASAVQCEPVLVRRSRMFTGCMRL